ncbi:MAG: hypothetical protein H0U59_10595 [Gemmatimonadaceae bacterium]|nr:hypothetical protein [Gemmatimonadaceae bacterium]
MEDPFDEVVRRQDQEAVAKAAADQADRLARASRADEVRSLLAHFFSHASTRYAKRLQVEWVETLFYISRKRDAVLGWSLGEHERNWYYVDKDGDLRCQFRYDDVIFYGSEVLHGYFGSLSTIDLADDNRVAVISPEWFRDALANVIRDIRDTRQAEEEIRELISDYLSKVPGMSARTVYIDNGCKSVSPTELSKLSERTGWYLTNELGRERWFLDTDGILLRQEWRTYDSSYSCATVIDLTQSKDCVSPSWLRGALAVSLSASYSINPKDIELEKRSHRLVHLEAEHSSLKRELMRARGKDKRPLKRRLTEVERAIAELKLA